MCICGLQIKCWKGSSFSTFCPFSHVLSFSPYFFQFRSEKFVYRWAPDLSLWSLSAWWNWSDAAQFTLWMPHTRQDRMIPLGAPIGRICTQTMPMQKVNSWSSGENKYTRLIKLSAIALVVAWVKLSGINRYCCFLMDIYIIFLQGCLVWCSLLSFPSPRRPLFGVGLMVLICTYCMRGGRIFNSKLVSNFCWRQMKS